MILSQLTFFILELNGAIDRREGDEVSIDDVEAHVEAGNIIPWLQTRLAGGLGGLDLGVLTPESITELTTSFQDILATHKGKEHRKWIVEHSGLCLLIAWTVELIQRREWQDRPEGVKAESPPARAWGGGITSQPDEEEDPQP